MEHAAKYLSKDPTPDDVLSIFAGLRPLVTSGGAQNTSKISREHTILVSPSGLISVTGGKWNTYRKMAEEVVDRAEKTAGLEKQNCVTEYLKIHGWTLDSIPESHLSVYGSDVSAIREIEQQNPELGERLHPHFPYRKSEVIWQVREEMARTVEDVLARRTRSLPPGHASPQPEPHSEGMQLSQWMWDSKEECDPFGVPFGVPFTANPAHTLKNKSKAGL